MSMNPVGTCSACEKTVVGIAYHSEWFRDSHKCYTCGSSGEEAWSHVMSQTESYKYCFVCVDKAMRFWKHIKDVEK